MSKTCMRSRQRCRRSKTMRANLPPRLSPSVEPPSNGMELQQRQRYVPYTHERNYACRITECTFRGLRSVILENQIIRISVAADKGADIYEFLHKPTDTEFLLRTPAGTALAASCAADHQLAGRVLLRFLRRRVAGIVACGGRFCLRVQGGAVRPAWRSSAAALVVSHCRRYSRADRSDVFR